MFAHNSFAQPCPFQVDLKGEEDNFHFVAYVPVNGTVYELDGLQNGPIPITKYEDLWTKELHPHLLKRMSNDVRFSLMAVMESKTSVLTKRIKLGEDVKHELLIEEEKQKFIKSENIKRRHDYTPLLLELLKSMAKIKLL